MDAAEMIARDAALFAQELTAFRATLAPSHQILLDDLVHLACSADTDVAGYGFDLAAARRAALRTVLSAGLIAGLGAGAIEMPMADSSARDALPEGDPRAFQMPFG